MWIFVFTECICQPAGAWYSASWELSRQTDREPAVGECCWIGRNTSKASLCSYFKTSTKAVYSICLSELLLILMKTLHKYRVIVILLILITSFADIIDKCTLFHIGRKWLAIYCSVECCEWHFLHHQIAPSGMTRVQTMACGSAPMRMLQEHVYLVQSEWTFLSLLLHRLDVSWWPHKAHLLYVL